MFNSQNLTGPEIQHILAGYNIVQIDSYKLLRGGSANTNYVITSNNNAFVLTICQEKSKEETIKLAQLLKHLHDHNFSTSKIIAAKNGNLTSAWNGYPILIKEFIAGTVIEDFSENLLLYLGSELGKLHKIPAPNYLPDNVAFGLNHFHEVDNYAPNSEFNSWLKHTQSYITKNISINLPKALLHTDIFYSNIVVHEDGIKASIMDFEEACLYYRIFDIGMMIIGLCRDNKIINLHKVQWLLKGYQNEIELVPIEKKSLQAFTVYAATATAFWRHKNYNHVTISPGMENHYKEMKDLADAVMNMPNDCLIS